MRGRDKLLEVIEGIPLLRRQVDAALATGRPVTVALPPRPHARYDLVSGAEALEVDRASEGMGASISAGIRHLGDADAILLLLADLPEITHEDLVAVLDAEAPPDTLVRGATEGGEQGHPILIPSAAFADFADLEGDDGGRAAAARFPVRPVPLPGRRARLDLDTPEAWAAWRAGKD